MRPSWTGATLVFVAVVCMLGSLCSAQVKPKSNEATPGTTPEEVFYPPVKDPMKHAPTLRQAAVRRFEALRSPRVRALRMRMVRDREVRKQLAAVRRSVARRAGKDEVGETLEPLLRGASSRERDEILNAVFVDYYILVFERGLVRHLAAFGNDVAVQQALEPMLASLDDVWATLRSCSAQETR